VEGEAGRERLVAPMRGTTWPTHGEMLESTCSGSSAHDPPAAGCTCGVHGWHPTRASARRVCAVRQEVPGILEATGAVEVHEDGFRAQRGRPHTLVALPNRNVRQVERLTEAYGARVLRVDGPDELLAHCRAHGLGLAEATVTELLGAQRLEREHGRRRRRAVIGGLRVAAVLLALGGVGLLVDHGQEHGKTLHGRTGEVRVP
jgi:hypothetical protein